LPHEPLLDRFVQAQASTYDGALAEIRRGAKRTHWMWYIFPQFAGLGQSAMAQHFAIGSIDEARAYLDHPLLGPRYRECVSALQDLPVNDPVPVFGPIDAVKLKSSLTLFEAAQAEPLFAGALDRWYHGQRDAFTLRLLDPDPS